MLYSKCFQHFISVAAAEDMPPFQKYLNARRRSLSQERQSNVKGAAKFPPNRLVIWCYRYSIYDWSNHFFSQFSVYAVLHSLTSLSSCRTRSLSLERNLTGEALLQRSRSNTPTRQGLH